MRERPVLRSPGSSPTVRTNIIGLAVVAVCALVPLARTARMIASSSHAQYNDYWPMIDGLLGHDGSLRLAGLFEFRNEHPIFIPRVAYWLNAELFGGDNHALGLFAVGVVLAQVGSVALLARSTKGLGHWAEVSLVVAATALLFSPYGAWSFVKAMSGTAWLTANVFVLAALAAQQRGRTFLAPGLALLATWSYGTGLAAWPALVVVAAMGDRDRLRRSWPTLAAGAGVITWYLLWFRDYETTLGGRVLLDEAHKVVERLGWPLVGPELAFEVGLVCVAALATGAALVARDRSKLEAAAPWAGLATYGITSCVLIVHARPDMFLTGLGLSRYASLGTLTWLAALALVLVGTSHLGGRLRSLLPALLALPLVLASWFGGGWVLDGLAPSTRQHEILTVAMHLGLADGSSLSGGRPFPEVTERLRRSGHHPFDGRFDLDCGDLGSTVEIAGTSRVEGTWREVDPRAPGAIAMRGSIADTNERIRCVVVLDGDARVVGAGPWWGGEGDGVEFHVFASEVPDPRVAFRLVNDLDYHLVEQTAR